MNSGAIRKVTSNGKTLNRGPGTASLLYCIYEARLFASFGKEALNVAAASGGAGGSKDTPKGKARQHTVAKNNPYYTALKENSGVPGGPLPVGLYYVDPPLWHPHLHLCARLRFPKGNQRFGRDGFFIHGQGRKGSDGCIVVLGKEHFLLVMDRLKQSGGGTLHVVESVEPVRFA